MDGNVVAPGAKLVATETSKEELDQRLDAADQKIKRLAQNFNMVAADLFQEEMERFQSATSVGGDVEIRNKAVKSVFTVTHDMRGLSKTFGYPLLGEVSSSCADFIKNRDVLETDKELEIVRLHLGALILIAKQATTGDGSAEGMTLMSQLTAATGTVEKVETGA
jgi:hypothetical protein